MHSPFQKVLDGVTHQVIDKLSLAALFIVAVISLLLIKGTQESAFVNGIIVVVKVAIVVMIIIFGWSYINPETIHLTFLKVPYLQTNTALVIVWRYNGNSWCRRNSVLCFHRI
jgi:basic amino acid/polyamine antiporter, APA family